MMKMELLTKKSWYDLGFEIEKVMIIPLIMGFFLARADVLSKLTPFGVAFLSSYIIMKGTNVFLLISVILGTITFQFDKGLSYILASILIHLFFNNVQDGKGYSLVKSSLVASLIFTICRFTGLLISSNVFIYDLFIVVFESITVFTMIYIFSYSYPIEKAGGSNFNNEKIICSFITLAIVLIGFKDISMFDISMKNFITILAVLYISYGYGAMFGATTGIILGMIGYISNTEMPFIIGIFAISGLLAGIFRDLDKIGTVIGFIIGNAIISFYINGLGVSFLNYKEIFLAVAVFLITSKSINEKISNVFSEELNSKKDYVEKRDQLVINKLYRIVELFHSLSNTFKDSVKEYNLNGVIEAYSVVDGVVNHICAGCSKNEECWEANYYRTYQSFVKLVGAVELKSSNNTIYEEANSFCIRYSEAIDKIDRSIERIRINHSWKEKLNENRLLVSEQLDGLSVVIEDITKDIYNDPRFNKTIEETIYKDLKNRRVDIKDISVSQIGDDDIEIFIDLNSANINMDKLKTMVSTSVGFPVVSDNGFNSISSTKQRFKLLRNNRFSAMTKVAALANSENKLCGDSFTYGEVETVHYSAISDGMGIGRKASEESKSAISLLEKLLEVSVDKNIILKTINSVLRAKSNEEIFATLDISFIDLYLGKLQMIKTGAPATFIKKKDRVEIINVDSLPVGLLKDVDFNVYEEYIEDGDIIIMVSDGIIDCNRNIDNPEVWLKEIIETIETINPQSMANEILKIAREESDGHRDDMTVVVTKVWKNI